MSIIHGYEHYLTFKQICLIGQCASGLGYGPPHGMGRHVVAVEPYDLMMVRKVRESKLLS